jgi:hypothetical protein
VMEFTLTFKLVAAAVVLVLWGAKKAYSSGLFARTPSVPVSRVHLANDWLAAFQLLMSDAMDAKCPESVGLLNELISCHTARGIPDMHVCSAPAWKASVDQEISQ